MSTLIKWKEPQSVVDWDRHEKMVPQVKILRLFAKYTLILSMPLLLSTWFWAPSVLVTALLGLFFTGCVYPALLYCQCLPRRLERQNEIGDEKICQRVGHVCNVSFKWSNIRAYTIVDHPALLEIRCLHLTVRNYKWEGAFDFNFSPNDVDEQRLREIMDEQLTKSLL